MMDDFLGKKKTKDEKCLTRLEDTLHCGLLRLLLEEKLERNLLLLFNGSLHT